MMLLGPFYSFLNPTMKFLAIAIICAIVSAASGANENIGETQGTQGQGTQGTQEQVNCSGKSEQDCKNTQGCQGDYELPPAVNDDDRKSMLRLTVDLCIPGY